MGAGHFMSLGQQRNRLMGEVASRDPQMEARQVQDGVCFFSHGNCCQLPCPPTTSLSDEGTSRSLTNPAVKTEGMPSPALSENIRALSTADSRTGGNKRGGKGTTAPCNQNKSLPREPILICKCLSRTLKCCTPSEKSGAASWALKGASKRTTWHLHLRRRRGPPPPPQWVWLPTPEESSAVLMGRLPALCALLRIQCQYLQLRRVHGGVNVVA